MMPSLHPNQNKKAAAEVRWEIDPEDPRIIRPMVYDSKGKVFPATWAPQKGSQEQFLNCPLKEVLYEGTRGPGKTDALLMDFAQEVGKGWGEEWKGIIFRRTYPELQDIIEKSKKWFRQFEPEAVFNESKTFWRWPTGEILYFRQFQKPEDYWKYHGHAYPFIGWEELTTWPDDKCFKSMFSCSRSTKAGIPIKIRATTNPYGIGHNWVKIRYRLPVPAGKIRGKVIRDSLDQDGNLETPRVAIRGHIDENRILLTADPTYKQRIAQAARNPAEKAAWLDGSWDIVAGGMFDDGWYEVNKTAVVEPFDIPASWIIDRAFDWGSSKPFSVGWWAQSDGSDVRLRNGKWRSTVRGDLFLIHEWYGWNGTPNEGLKMLATDITKGIVERELKWGIHGRVYDGPADSSIFDDENGNCIADDMALPVRLDDGRQVSGIGWEKADKSPGSRKQGWEQMRKLLMQTKPKEPGLPREQPGLFVFNTCAQWLRTIPTLPRSDKHLDDVDTEAEDHIGDMTRYRARFERPIVKSGRTVGAY